jgi:hypothetical protein
MKYLIQDVTLSTLLLMALAGCDFNRNFGAGNTFNDHRPAITGKFLRPDCLSPAAGVIVTLQPRSVTTIVSGSAKRSINKRTILTDSDGRFTIDSCNSGIYTIEGIDNEGNAVRIDSVIVTDSQATTELQARPLQLTGALKGKVLLDAGGDPSNVFILVFGSDRFVQVRSDGMFLMNDLSYGNYELKIVCILREYVQSYSVPAVVVPNDTVSIGSITLQSQELCVPKNVILEYDTMKFAVTLKWNVCPGKDELQGYNIYRYNKNENDQYAKEPLNDACIEGTSFIDASIQPNQTYVYGVAVVTTSGIIGRKSEPLMITSSASPFHADTIRKIDGMKAAGVFWDVDNTLIAAYDTPWLLSVVNYSDDGESYDRTDISLPYETKYKSVYINNHNIYIIMNLFDSTIVCYNRSGLMQYECNLHHRITHWCVNNDTLIAGWDTAGSFCTNAFNSTGKLLYNINEPQSCFPGTYAVCTTDGRIISTRCSETKDCMLVANETTGLTMPQFSTGDLYFLDACGDRYLFCTNDAFNIITAANEFIARIPLSSLSGPPIPIYCKKAAISCQGKIAFFQGGNLVVVKLP